MILKSIELKNIRSYANETIIFPTGTILFEGDIGSGKSTILLAIEFALFGLGDLKGAYLLKTGCQTGQVKLKFEVDGKEYEVYRTIARKGKTVRQEEGYLKYDGRERPLSASELKQEVLGILKFNEPPDPKSQSVIYRYAVYTPQEQMKEILWANPDQRLQTLRKAFGIEDYKVARENAQLLVRVANDQLNRLKGKTEDLERLRSRLKDKQTNLQNSKSRLTELEEERKLAEQEYTSAKSKLDELSASFTILKASESQIPIYEKQLKEKASLIINYSSESYELYRKMFMVEAPEIERCRSYVKPTDFTVEELEQELKRIRSLENQLRKHEAEIDVKIGDYRKIEENKICPTCDREADPSEFKGKVSAKEAEKRQVSERLREVMDRTEEAQDLLKKRREFDRLQEELSRHLNNLSNYSDRVEANHNEISRLAKELAETRRNISEASENKKRLEAISEKLTGLKKTVDEQLERLNNISSEMRGKEEAVKLLENDIQDLSDQITAKEESLRLMNTLSEYTRWLGEYFIPCLDNIEKHVMVSIYQEFNRSFQKWFSLLVDATDKQARIDEDFNPIVEQDGYELPLDSYSGGEKTSVALAYRLTLNTIVQGISVGLKSNLLILDEPTDGFSKEQLYKVREILDEINSPQVIIVSHERELESFADHVFRIEKVNGVSKIIGEPNL